MIKIKFRYWQECCQVLQVRIKDTIIINVPGYVAQVVNAVKRLKPRVRKQETTDNSFLARYQNAGFFSRHAVRMCLVIIKLRMGNRR